MATIPKDRGFRYLSAGLTMVTCAALFGFGGYLLDDQIHTLPLFLVLGVLLGFGGGFLHLLRIAAPQLLPFDRRRKTSPRDPGKDTSETDTR